MQQTSFYMVGLLTALLVRVRCSCSRVLVACAAFYQHYAVSSPWMAGAGDQKTSEDMCLAHDREDSIYRERPDVSQDPFSRITGLFECLRDRSIEKD